jgi:hypothetical protein
MQRMTSIVAGAGSKSTARRRGAPFCGERGEVTRSPVVVLPSGR